MKIKFSLLLIVLTCTSIFAQLDNQKRLQSDQRKYYTWNYEEKKYELKETEYEHSIIDIREIGSKTNGYIVISMLDNGLTRLQHGSIYSYTQNSENEGTWLFKSKNSKDDNFLIASINFSNFKVFYFYYIIQGRIKSYCIYHFFFSSFEKV